MHHPPGTVGVLTTDLTRYAWAMVSLRMLDVPLGSQITWVSGHWVSKAVNNIIRSMRPEDAWVCLLTDDNPFEGDMLMRLLDHQVPIVAPLVSLRIPPYQPSLFRARDNGTFQGITLDELPPPPGLMQVDSFGGPGVVIRREVIEKVGMPFFENMPGPLGREEPCEDLYTFSKCRAAGYDLHVDLSLCIGHCITAIVTPEWNEEQGRWVVRVWSHTSLGTLTPEEMASGSEIPAPPH